VLVIAAVGIDDGVNVDFDEGVDELELVGTLDGLTVTTADGDTDGFLVGMDEVKLDGFEVETIEGLEVARKLGLIVG
jgi:hypothetical protein